MIRAIAFSDLNITFPQTMGGRIWWNTIISENGYRIQQNLISKHYRLLNSMDQRITSSFDLDKVKEIGRAHV